MKKDRRTAFERLEDVSKIEDVNTRIEVLRNECIAANALAIAIQYTYHPEFNLDMPEGDLPESVLRIREVHDDYGAFFRTLRKLKSILDLPEQKRERLFVEYYETVAVADRKLMIALKDKKLPWKTLDEAFCREALPELFPAPVTNGV